MKIVENKTVWNSVRIQQMLGNANTLDGAIQRLADHVQKPYDIGRGGHHVWVNNEKNERILMIME